MNAVKKLNDKLISIMEKYGIVDKRKQREFIIEIINAFTSR